MDSSKPLSMKFSGHSRSKNQLTFSYEISDLRFQTSIWYENVDFYALESRWGLEFMTNIYFHIGALDATKFVSLRPNSLDWGEYNRFVTPAFALLWEKVIKGVWAQWRYENDAPTYFGPAFQAHGSAMTPISLTPGPTPVLSLCGGGKDSLLGMRLLKRGGVPFDSLGYSHSTYGRSEEQHHLIEKLITQGNPVKRRKIWIYDDFLDSPIIQLRNDFESRSLTAAETPLSIFVALPMVLSSGYSYLCFAHEKSADFGNCVWDLTGETINHQWGKSTEAEVIFDDYITSNLIANVNIFSILKPLYDLGIFSLLQKETDALSAAHSCNVEKPWCMKCPKCAYVWLNYKAWFRDETVDPIFNGRNLFDLPENQLAFRQLLGLDEHTPFECIGTVDESRLAFELCRLRGVTGQAMDGYVNSGISMRDPLAIARAHLKLADYSHMPKALAPSISELLREAEPNGIAYVSSLINHAA